MKRIALTLFAILCTVVAMAAPKRILVNTVEEFIGAIGSNREIVICNEEGFLLTPLINQMIDEGKIKEYDRSSRAPQAGLRYEREHDGPMLVLVGFENLTIRTNSDDRYSIEVTPRYANVLTFISCKNIKLSNLYLGHTVEGYCTNGVVAFDDCTGITIENCGLFGCGTEGVELRQCKNFTMTNSEIFHCSYHIMHIAGSANCKFTNCLFYNNKEFGQVNIDSSSENVLFDRCSFVKNKGTLFCIENPSNVVIRHCLIQHDGDAGNGYESYQDCMFAHDNWK